MALAQGGRMAAAMTVLFFVAAILAVYRVAHMLVDEEGPFSMIHWIKSRDFLDPQQKTWLGRGLNCVWCMSFWLALPLVLVLQGEPWYLWWLAVAGGVLITSKVLDHRD
jgi:hypothetical protein